MGRTIRRVPADWIHPVYTRDTAPSERQVGWPVPLFEGKDLDEEIAEWDEGERKWAEGLRPDYDAHGKQIWIEPGGEPLQYRGKDDTWEEWGGSRPDPADYMPNWPDAERTHIAMYEDTTEGTPISPVFKTGEALAHWLADNNASSFGDHTATYESWLSWIRDDGIVDDPADVEAEMSKPIWAQ